MSELPCLDICLVLIYVETTSLLFVISSKTFLVNHFLINKLYFTDDANITTEKAMIEEGKQGTCLRLYIRLH